MEMREYPTEDELKKIVEWPIEDPFGLVNLLEELWHWPDLTITKKNGRTQIFRKPCMRLYLSTGGWSGNESIVESLQKNSFWFFFWLNSHRGGHYEFEIPKEWKNKK